MRTEGKGGLCRGGAEEIAASPRVIASDDPSEIAVGFIVGPPRCGTTLLGYLLGGAPGVASLSEPFLAHAIYGPRRLKRFFRRMRSGGGNRAPSPSPPVRSSPNEFLAYLRVVARTQGMDRLLVKETYRQDQSWDNVRLLDWIAEGPHPVAAITRHPYDAAVSTLKFCRWWRGVTGRMARLWAPGLPIFRDDRHLMEYFSRNWRGFVQWSRKHSLVMTRYEDLVTETERELRRVCAACGIPFDPRMLDDQQERESFGGIGSPDVIGGRPRPVNATSVGRRSLLAPELQEIVRSGCAESASSLGYDL